MACPPGAWHDIVLAGPQRYEIRDALPGRDGSEILGISFGPLVGQYPKVYLFIEYLGSCPLQAVSLMSGASAVVPTESHPPGSYALTHYHSEGEDLLREFISPPRYDYVKTQALKVLRR